MRNSIILSVFALLSTTLFSCTADEYETAETKTDIKKETPAQADVPPDGPGDDPINVNPPKK